MDVGILSQRQDMSYEDLLLMINMLRPYKETLTLFLDLFKSEDEFIKFLDLFAGRQISLPSRSRLYFVMFNIDVYRYYQNHKDAVKELKYKVDKEAVKKTADHFNITTQRVNAIIERVTLKS